MLAAKLFAPAVTATGTTPTVFAACVGLVGISFSFGLTVLGRVFAFGHPRASPRWPSDSR